MSCTIYHIIGQVRNISAASYRLIKNQQREIIRLSDKNKRVITLHTGTFKQNALTETLSIHSYIL